MSNKLNPETAKIAHRILTFMIALKEEFEDMKLQDYWFDIGKTGEDEVPGGLFFGYELKPEWAKGKKYCPVSVFSAITKEGFYRDCPIWIAICNEELWEKTKNEFKIVDENKWWVGIDELPFRLDAEEVDIKKSAIEFADKIKHIIKK